MSVELIDYANLRAGERDALAAFLAPVSNLDRVLTWGRGLDPPCGVDDILTLDEYTHDVVMRLAENHPDPGKTA